MGVRACDAHTPTHTYSYYRHMPPRIHIHTTSHLHPCTHAGMHIDTMSHLYPVRRKCSSDIDGQRGRNHCECIAFLMRINLRSTETQSRAGMQGAVIVYDINMYITPAHFGLTTISVLRPRALTCHGRRGSSGQKDICRKVHGDVVLHAHGKRALTFRETVAWMVWAGAGDVTKEYETHSRPAYFCNLSAARGAVTFARRTLIS